MYRLSFAIVVASGVSYQILQKKIAPEANPALSLGISYLVSLLAAAALLFVFPLRKPLDLALHDLKPSSYLLGLPIIGVEFGFLMMYRSGGGLSYSPALTSTAMTLCLVLIGVIAFKESMSFEGVMLISHQNR
jgi:drug/metabolite transporter (DMT)-like permease